MYTKNCTLASSKPIHCFSPLGRKLDVGWPRIEDFQLRGHSCVNNVQRCLCHFYTWMRHSKQTATLLLTKHHANFDTSTSAKGYARVCTNCACAIVVIGILLARARPTMPCIRLVIISRVLTYVYVCSTRGRTFAWSSNKRQLHEGQLHEETVLLKSFYRPFG